jgi:ketosteroid isomerase-like protein
VHSFYEAFVRGDLNRASAYLTPDVILHVPGRGANAGEYWGHEGFTRFVNNIQRYNGGMFRMHVGTMAVGDHTVFTREVLTINRRVDPAREWLLGFVMEYRFRGNQISEVWVVPEDQKFYDEYWSAPVPSTDSAQLIATPTLTFSAATALPNRASLESMALLQELYRRFWNGEFDTIEELVTADVEFVAPGDGYLSGRSVGYAGYLEFRRKLTAIAGGKYHLDLASIASGPTDVFAREYIRMNTTRNPEVGIEYVVMHFQIRDGKVARMNDFPLDLYRWQDFFRP